MSIYEKLIQVQNELNAPKSNYNDYGGYSYRSCEDIVEAVKPILAEQGLLLLLEDNIVVKGDRYYIKAIATITDGDENISVSAFAREQENRKGMDTSQITGAASSYARKYALNGLLAIDDNKDADSTNKHRQICSAKNCNKELTDEVVKNCNNNSNKFDGRLFCTEHQEKYIAHKNKKKRGE